MGVKIREVDVRREADVLLPLLRENLPEHGDERQFRWLYFDNPYGTARAWLAEDETTGTTIGSAAAFPRLMRVDGKDAICWNLGDFAIAKNHRSLGPAIALQRACLSEVLSGEVAFAYDHPSATMMAVYRWLKIGGTGKVIRFAKLRRVDDLVTRRLGKGPVSRIATVAGNAVLRMLDGFLGGRSNVERHDDAFGDEFAELEQRVGGSYRVVGARTPEYLNWRYRANPTQRYVLLTLREAGRLTGYTVVRQSGSNATVVDLYGEPEGSVTEKLIGGTLAMLRRTETRAVSVPLLETSPLIAVLRRRGYVARESAHFVVSTRPGGAFSGIVDEPENWYHTDGDRDV